VRELQAVRVEWSDGAGDEAEAGVAAQFGAFVEEKLHTEAESEERFAVGCEFAQGVVKSEGAETTHRFGKRADAREDESVGGPHRSEVGGAFHVGADALQRFFD